MSLGVRAIRGGVVAFALAAGALAATGPAGALIGGEPDGRFADRVVMVLSRGGGLSGFCSALVLSPRIVLTAAHCVKSPGDMAVHYRDATGAPVLIPVEAAIAHPLYRADATARRVVSIDLALVKTQRPLDARFGPGALGGDPAPAVGDPVILSGYGVARDGEPRSGGVLRAVTLAVRAPASKILIWAADSEGREAGACSGDSGGPLWSADGSKAVAIVAWSQGRHGRGCGGLTQGPLIAPQRAWIDETMARLGATP